MRGKPAEAKPGVVLLVEDDDAYREAAQTLLENEGYTVLIATHGGEAVRQARAHAPDVILLDLAMPTLDGLEALPSIRQADASKSRPHIIALSASEDANTRELAFARGCDQYIVKSSSPETITAAVATVFWKRQHSPASRPV